MAAAAFCRQYVLSSPSRLLMSSHRVWRSIVEKTDDQEAMRHLSFQLLDEFQSAFVGWLLIWRLVLDQADHNLSKRFGKESPERSLLNQARSNAYDAHQGYRVIEAVRNLVQHQEMPPFNIRRGAQLDPQSGAVTRKIEVTFPVSWLLESPKCPAKIKGEFQGRPTEVLSVVDVVDDAMAGFQEILVTLFRVNYPEMLESVTLLRQIFGEAHPGVPVLLKMRRPPAGSRLSSGAQFDMHRIDDLLRVVQEAPIGNPYQPQDNVDV